MADFDEEKWFDDGVATFGDRLEAARLAAGLSVEELAARIGVRARTVRSWEADEFEPRGNRLQMLAGMLSVSLTWLMSGQGPGVSEGQATRLPEAARAALTQLTELRVKMQALSQEMAQAEQKLLVELRELAE